VGSPANERKTWWGEAPERPYDWTEAADYAPSMMPTGLTACRGVTQRSATARRVLRPSDTIRQKGHNSLSLTHNSFREPRPTNLAPSRYHELHSRLSQSNTQLLCGLRIGHQDLHCIQAGNLGKGVLP
jgi:hypothetical protein